MSKVVIIGAGGVGSVVAHMCAKHPKVFSNILLASRTLQKCKHIAQSVREKHGIEIETTQLDAENIAETTSLLRKFQADLVIHVALPYQDLTIMESCLNAKAHYLDTANYEPKEEAKFSYSWQWAYHEKFKKAGLTALLGCGFDPGVTGVFVAYAANHYFDTLSHLDIIDCNAGTHDQPFATNFNTEINIREITQKGRYYEQGQWIETAPQSMHKLIDYPNIGPRKSYLIYHEELESLVKYFPTLKTARFWMTFSDTYLNYLKVIMDIGLGSIRPVKYRGAEIVPLQFLQSLLPPAESLAPHYTGETSIGCRMSGQYKGQSQTCYIYNNCSHQAAFQETGSHAVSYTTGVPASIGARLLLEGEWRTSGGVFNVEQLNPDPFMQALNLEGLPWHVKLGEPLGMDS